MNFLNEDQIKKFHRDGYLILRNVFEKDEVSRIKDLFNLLLKDASQYKGKSYLGEDCHYVFDNGNLNRIVWCGGRQNELLNFSKDKRIIGPVSDLLKTKDLTQIINQAHFKLPGEEVEFVWHQDSEHRRYGTNLWNDIGENGSYIQCVMAVDTMTKDNGPLKAIRYSHKKGHLGLKENPEIVHQFPKEDFITLDLREGDLIFFGPYLIHSSSLNESDKQRRVFINGFCTPGANEKDYPGIGKGLHIEVH